MRGYVYVCVWWWGGRGHRQSTSHTHALTHALTPHTRADATAAYAKELRRKLRAAGLHADADLSDRTMQKKVREAQLSQYNYILVRWVGVCAWGGAAASGGWGAVGVCVRGVLVPAEGCEGGGGAQPCVFVAGWRLPWVGQRGMPYSRCGAPTALPPAPPRATPVSR